MQITFPGGGQPPNVWDARSKADLPTDQIEGQAIHFSSTIPRFANIRFVAKIALASGYHVFRGLFREKTAHEEIRRIMNAETYNDFVAIAPHIQTRVDDPFMDVKEEDRNDRKIFELLCSTTHGSIVGIVPGPSNLSIFVGVLGRYMGMVNISANTSGFPTLDQFDLGHCLTVTDGRLATCSYRQRVGLLYQHLTGDHPPAPSPV